MQHTYSYGRRAALIAYKTGALRDISALVARLAKADESIHDRLRMHCEAEDGRAGVEAWLLPTEIAAIMTAASVDAVTSIDEMPSWMRPMNRGAIWEDHSITSAYETAGKMKAPHGGFPMADYLAGLSKLFPDASVNAPSLRRAFEEA